MERFTARSVARSALAISSLAALTAASYAVHTSLMTVLALYGRYWRRHHPPVVMQRRELGRGVYYVD